jgi:hypothetical protein
MKKTCSKCGKPFEAFKPEFDTCPKCNKKPSQIGERSKSMNTHQSRDSHNSHQREERSNQYNQSRPSSHEEIPFLQNFYTETGAICRRVYIDDSKEIARIFYENNMSSSSIRRYYVSVLGAYERYLMDHSFDRAMECIYRLRAKAHYDEERGVTKKCFTKFIDHYIELTSKDEKNLKGFKELFMCVIGYMPKDRDRR